MIKIMAGAGRAVLMLFSWLGKADAGAASDQSKKDDEMEVKKGYASDVRCVIGTLQLARTGVGVEKVSAAFERFGD